MPNQGRRTGYTNGTLTATAAGAMWTTEEAMVTAQQTAPTDQQYLAARQQAQAMDHAAYAHTVTLGDAPDAVRYTTTPVNPPDRNMPETAGIWRVPTYAVASHEVFHPSASKKEYDELKIAFDAKSKEVDDMRAELDYIKELLQDKQVL